MICQMCSARMVDPVGNPNSSIIIAGDFPGYEDIRSGRIFSGDTGEILSKEMSIVGLPRQKIFLTAMMLHEPKYAGKSVDTNDICYRDNRNAFFDRCLSARLVLLMGSEFSDLYGGDTIGHSGLVISFPAGPNNTVYMASPNPGVCAHSSVGEFRLALQKFKSKIEELGL